MQFQKLPKEWGRFLNGSSNNIVLHGRPTYGHATRSSAKMHPLMSKHRRSNLDEGNKKTFLLSNQTTQNGFFNEDSLALTLELSP